MWGLFKMEEICNVCGFIEKDHVNSVHAFIKITKEAKTPNYPKEIEAKMTKEKPLSEKIREADDDAAFSFWAEDVALAVKRLKELDDLTVNKKFESNTIGMMTRLFRERVDAIFGEFK